MYQYYNPNPTGRTMVGDCSIRAIAKALGVDWEKAYAMVVVNGFRMGDVISSDTVWGSVLRMNGFVRENLPHYCKDCYTIRDFVRDHPEGIYVIGTGSHVVTAIDGTYFDTWDSGDETPIYYWYRR
jgi:hypothetical protein